MFVTIETANGHIGLPIASILCIEDYEDSGCVVLYRGDYFAKEQITSTERSTERASELVQRINRILESEQRAHAPLYTIK